MDIRFLNVPGAPPPPPTAAYSHAVRAGDYLFVTGQLGVDPKSNALVAGGAEAQAKQIMRNLETVLGGAGTSLERTVMATLPREFRGRLSRREWRVQVLLQGGTLAGSDDGGRDRPGARRLGRGRPHRRTVSGIRQSSGAGNER